MIAGLDGGSHHPCWSHGHLCVGQRTSLADQVGGLEPSARRSHGKVLKISLRRPATVIYHLQANGALDATYAWARGMTRATCTRVTD